jgi:cytoskeletal protein CcmA (bactofilin family)
VAVFKRRKPDEPMGEDQSAVAATPGAGDPPHPAAPGEPGLASQGDRPAESGLGVPPFQPAPPKESNLMARPPFGPAPTPGAGIPPAGGLPGSLPGALPGARPLQPGGIPARPQQRDPGERRTLVVGRGISVQGTVTDAERLVVEGIVEATMIRATELAVAPGGVFKGEVEVEDAEVAGTIDGTVTARGSLIVRASGKVLGTAHCRRLQVEDGGQITGRIEMMSESHTAAPKAEV